MASIQERPLGNPTEIEMSHIMWGHHEHLFYQGVLFNAIDKHGDKWLIEMQGLEILGWCNSDCGLKG